MRVKLLFLIFKHVNLKIERVVVRSVCDHEHFLSVVQATKELADKLGVSSQTNPDLFDVKKIW